MNCATIDNGSNIELALTPVCGSSQDNGSSHIELAAIPHSTPTNKKLLTDNSQSGNTKFIYVLFCSFNNMFAFHYFIFQLSLILVTLTCLVLNI